MLLARRSVAEKLKLPILAKFVAYAIGGVAPEIMGIGKIFLNRSRNRNSESSEESQFANFGHFNFRAERGFCVSGNLLCGDFGNRLEESKSQGGSHCSRPSIGLHWSQVDCHFAARVEETGRQIWRR